MSARSARAGRLSRNRPEDTMTTRTLHARLCGAGPAALCILLAPAPLAFTQAAAATGPDVAVRYGDLSLNRPDDAAQLLDRIAAASHDVCAPLDHGDIASRRNRARCQDQLIAAAVGKVNHPALTAAYEQSRQVNARVAGAGKRSNPARG
jgi:UrcA family protein